MGKTLRIGMMLLVLVGILCACEMPNVSGDGREWRLYEQSANGSTVRLYGWDGDAAANKWFDEVLAKRLKDDYGITLKRVPATYDTIFQMLRNDQEQKRTVGEIDLLWISGSNFEMARNNNMLFGAFTGKLPNYEKYLDPKDPEVTADRGFPIKGYSVPLGKKQLTLFVNNDGILEPPTDLNTFMTTVRDHPGKFTYPDPSDPLGMAFIDTIVCQTVGYNAVASTPANRNALAPVVAPALDYMRQMKPYLWQAGRRFPTSEAELKALYEEGQILMTMSMDNNHATRSVEDEKYPQGTRPFTLKGGTVGTTHYLAIPYNSANKSGAMVVINACLLPEIQTEKFKMEVWGDIPVTNLSVLTPDELRRMKKSVTKKTSPQLEDLLQHRYPQFSVATEAVLQELWREAMR